MKLQESEITGVVTVPSSTKKEVVKTEPILELKNDYQDEKFMKSATIVTIIVFILSFLIKIFLLQRGKVLDIHNFMDVLLIISQFVLLGITVYGYYKKKVYPKYTGLVASILLIFTFHLVDVLLGVLYFLFCVDQNIYVSIFKFIKKKIKRG